MSELPGRMHVAALHKWSLAQGREEKEGLQEKKGVHGERPVDTIRYC